MGGLIPALAAETKSNHPRISPLFQALMCTDSKMCRHPRLI